MRLIIEKARVSFAQSLFNPQEDDKGKKNYNCHLLIPNKGAELAKVVEVMKKVAIEKWGAKGEATFKALTSGGKTFLHSGAEKPDYEGYDGMMYLSVRSRVIPKLLNKDKTPATEEQGTLYSGCYVYAILDVYPQDHATYGKRINCSIGGLMVVADGEALGTSTKAKDEEFPDIADTGDELGMGDAGPNSVDDDMEALLNG